MIRTFIDDDLETRFARDGYIVLTLFSPEQAAELRAEIVPLMPDLSTCGVREINVTPYDPANPGDEWIYRLSAKPINAALLPLMTDMEQRFCSVLNKLPGWGAVGPHLHRLFQLDQAYPNVFCWCPLTDVDEMNGAMQVIPGSHKLLPVMRDTARTDYYWPFVEKLPAKMVTVPLKAGQALVFEDSIIHGSTPNRSNEDRLVLMANFINMQSLPITLMPTGDGQFEVLATGNQFNPHDNLQKEDPRSRGWESLGFVDDVHREIDEAEFDRLIASGKKFTGSYPLVPRRVPAPPSPHEVPESGLLSAARRSAGQVKRAMRRLIQ